MDYKGTLRLFKENEDWKKLLSTSLDLYKQDPKNRYIVRMIVLAYEKLADENDAVPFWEILAKGENKPEEFSKKLVDYYKKNGDNQAWLKWSKRLLSQSLRKKDFDTLEDIWMQLIEKEAIDKLYAFDITDKVESLGDKERAFTLLDFFLLSLEEKKPLHMDVLDIAKRMLDIDDVNSNLRKRLERFYSKIYCDCGEIENFIEKVDIKRSENVKEATNLLERLIKFCPGRYVSHKSWGIGKIDSIDLLFNKIFIDFPVRPQHTINIDLALNILTPLENDDFAVLKIEKRDYLLSLKNENPVQLIKLLLKDQDIIPQDMLKSSLKGIVNDDEWLHFIKQLKKYAQSENIEIQRKGSKYFFKRGSTSKEKRVTIGEIESLPDQESKLEQLIKIAEDELKPEEQEKWISCAEEIYESNDTPLQNKFELLFTQTDITGDKKRMKSGFDLLLKNVENKEKLLLINQLSQKQYKKELIQHIGEKDYSFAEQVFLKTPDDWLRAHANKILEENDKLNDLKLMVLQNPHKNPLCFLYLTEMVMKGKEKADLINKPIILFETILEFMSKKDEKHKIRSRAKTIFVKYGFDIFRWALKTSSKEEIKILLDIVKQEITVNSEDKKSFERLAESKHPSLKEKEIDDFFYVTKDAINKKKRELDQLLKVEIPANSEAIGKAASQGDLSENFDYISAKEKQRRLIDRVNILKKELEKARPIEEVAYVEGEIGIGTCVMLEDVEGKEKRELFILGPWDNFQDKEVISHTASLAAELMGKKVGETIFDKYHKKTYRIINVEKYVKKND